MSHPRQSPIPGFCDLELLEAGSVTTVYRAVREADKMPMVLKMCERAEDVPQLRREYDILQSLDDDDILKCYGMETHGSRTVLLIEDFGGVSLKRLLAEKQLSHLDLVGVFYEVALQLAVIHQRGIFHKDVNPGNIVANHETGDVRVIDFSIAAHAAREQRAHPGHLEGTLSYISPEQTGRMNRSLDYRTDFYSLGVSMYEAFGGHRPFPGDDPSELIHAHIAVDPPPLHTFNESLPPVLVSIIAKLMTKNPEDRYQSARGVASDLARCRQEWTETLDFPIAGEDFSSEFQIPQKVYGRDDELTLLSELQRRALRGGLVYVFLAGQSGAGKTALTRELQESVERPSSFYAWGKFDLYRRNTPYAALIQASRRLARQILHQGGANLTYWRTRLLDALGANASVMIEVVHELELIIGQTMPAPTLPAGEAENRFQLVLRKFFGVFAVPEHGLVLFLDNLHWADAASLRLLEHLPQEADIRALMVLGAYRAQDVGPHHPLNQMIMALKDSRVLVEHLNLGAISEDAVANMVADVLRREVEDVAELAKLVHERTGGSPFFVQEYLYRLKDESLFWFDYGRAQWQWDLARIRHVDFEGDVVEFVAGRIKRLPEETGDLLRVAACIGAQFDLGLLADVVTIGHQETVRRIWPAVLEGLISPLDDMGVGTALPNPPEGSALSFEFIHNRIQQACYTLLSRTRQHDIHLRIGRALYTKADARTREDHIFDIVNQYNLGIDMIETDEERRRLCQLNLHAGRKARAAGGYDHALTYLAVSRSLLPSDSWLNAYDLTMDVYCEQAACEQLRGHWAVAERLFEHALNNTLSDEDKAEIFALRVSLYTYVGLYAEALEMGLSGLNKLGLAFPDSNDLVRDRIEELRIELTDVFGKKSLQSLIDEFDEPLRVGHAATKLLLGLVAPAMHLNRSVMYLAILELVKRAIDKGCSTASACGFVGLGGIMVTVYGDVVSGERFARLGLRLATKYGDAELICQAETLYSALISPWRGPLRLSLPRLYHAYEQGREAGVLLWTAIAAFHVVQQRLVKGDHLNSAVDACERFLDELEGVGEDHIRQALRVTRALLLQLEDRPDEEPVDYQQFVGHVQKRLYILALVHYYHLRSWHAYLMGDLDLALRMAVEADKLEIYAADWPQVAEFWFYDALIRAAILDRDDLDEDDRTRHLEHIRLRLGKLTEWASRNSSGFRARMLLVQAELARVEQNGEKAVESYEAAINAAADEELTHVEALGCECAGRFFLAKGNQRVARVYLRDAVMAFRRWGAVAKARQLEFAYAELLAEIALPSPTFSQNTTSTMDLGETLDLQAVIETARTIVSEIHLDPLLKKLVRISLQNAGASNGLLILERESTLTIVVEGRSDPTPTVTPRNAPVSAEETLSVGIVYYVHNTGEAVVLGNAAKEGRFTADPYILEHQPKSVLCLPIVTQGKKLGVLYLENKVLAEAFTRDRLDLLRLVMAEAAIAIENARLYEHLSEVNTRLRDSYGRLEEQNRTLEENVEERTRELRSKNVELEQALQRLKNMQQQIIQQEKMASLGSLTAGIAHEIRNPLNFVNNFADVSAELVGELRELIAIEHAGQGDGETRNEIGDIMNNLDQNLTRIHEHGGRANLIVNAMLRHSHQQSSADPEPVDLNRLLDEYIQLAYHGVRARSERFDIRIIRDFDSDLPMVSVFPQDISRVVLNIVDNACYAVTRRQESESDFEGELKVWTRKVAHGVALRFRDNGVGIPQDVLDQMFTPFFTTKPVGEGTGLGMSISYDIIVKGHGGRLTVESKVGEFTEILIFLPLKKISIG